MTIQIIRGAEVNRPTPDALTSSILDHATVTGLESFGLRNNDGLYPSYNVLDTAVPTTYCPNPPSDKDFSFANWVEASEFAVYGGVQCKAVGLDRADMESELRRVFERNEGKGVEEHLLATFVAGAPVAVEDVTPVGASLGAALGVLVGYSAQVYAGQPTIHMPRAAATMLFGLGYLTERDGKFFTKTGAKVAAGGGYDSEDYPGDGVWDMYATGEVYVERSSMVDIGAFDQRNNDVLALAERMYRVAVDGFVAKASGKAW